MEGDFAARGNCTGEDRVWVHYAHRCSLTKVGQIFASYTVSKSQDSLFHYDLRKMVKGLWLKLPSCDGYRVACLERNW